MMKVKFLRGLTFAALFLAGTFAVPAYAAEDNFNQTAYDSASETGINNANCNSALVLFCDGGSNTVHGAPAPVFASGALGGIAVMGGLLVLFRRRC